MKKPSIFRKFTSKCWALLLLLGLSVHSNDAKADITMYVLATIYGNEAQTHKMLMLTAKDEDEKRTHQTLYMSAKQKSTTFLVIGLAIDALFLTIYFTALASSADDDSYDYNDDYYDRVARLEVEVANGGGPVLDALASGLGVDKATMLNAARTTLGAYRDSKKAGAQDLNEALIKKVAWNGRLTDHEAARILYALHLESNEVGIGQTPWHDRLAHYAGTSPRDIAASIARPIQAHLEAGIQEGVIQSPRSVLAADAATTLQSVVESIYEDHKDTIIAQFNVGESTKEMVMKYTEKPNATFGEALAH